MYYYKLNPNYYNRVIKSQESISKNILEFIIKKELFELLSVS